MNWCARPWRQALASNTDLRVAAASLARARAQVEEAEAAGGFSAGIKAGAQRLQESGQAFLLAEKVPVANVADISLSASYQFDLWGTLQRGIEAAKANADATQAAGDVARITLVADVVRSYTQVCAANEEREIAEHSLDLQAESTELTKRLRDAGRGDETQVTRSQTQFKSLRAELPRYTAARQAGLYRLSMLLAKPVDQLPAGVADCAALPHIAQLLPVGDGAELLKRRPDIRQAERRLAAATAGIGVTVPTNGARARIREAEATTQGVLAHFDGVVLNAIRETQTSLAQYIHRATRPPRCPGRCRAVGQAGRRADAPLLRRRPSLVPRRPAGHPYLHRCAGAVGFGQHPGGDEPDRSVPGIGRWLGKRTNATCGTDETLTPLLCSEVSAGRRRFGASGESPHAACVA